MKAKQRRELDRQINGVNPADYDLESPYEYEQYKQALKQEEIRRRRIRRETDEAD